MLYVCFGWFKRTKLWYQQHQQATAPGRQWQASAFAGSVRAGSLHAHRDDKLVRKMILTSRKGLAIPPLHPTPLTKSQHQLVNEEASRTAGVSDVGLASKSEDATCRFDFLASNLSFYSTCKCKNVPPMTEGTCSLSGFTFQPKKDGYTPFTPGFPASSPWVTSVGATQVWVLLWGHFLFVVFSGSILTPHPSCSALRHLDGARQCVASMLCALVCKSFQHAKPYNKSWMRGWFVNTDEIAPYFWDKCRIICAPACHC